MKKTKITALILIVLLTSCGSSTSQEIDSSKSDTSTSVTESINDNKTDILSSERISSFSTISEIYNHLKGDGEELEDVYCNRANRKTKLFEYNLYTDDYKTYEENISSYNNDAKFTSGTYTYERKSRDSYVSSSKETHNYSSLNIASDKYFYEITDFDEGKENDSARKYLIGSDITSTEIRKACNLSLTYLLGNYFDEYIMPNYSNDPIAFDYDAQTGDLTYYFASSYESTSSSYTSRYDIGFDLTFNSSNILMSYVFEVKEYDISTSTEYLYSSLLDEYTALDSNLKEDGDNFTINPLDYFMTDFDIQLYSDDLLGQSDSLKEIDKDEVEINSTIVAKVINPVPEKALDTNLNIIASSNSNIIKVEKYTDSNNDISYYAKAIATGNVTLTIQSESGISKTIDITVVNPKLNSLRIAVYSQKIYAGDSFDVYVYRDPDNNTDKLSASLNVSSDIATISSDGDDEYYHVKTYKACDNLIITVKNADESVTSSYSVKVLTKYSDSELKTMFVSKTYYSDYVYKDSNNNETKYEKANTLHFNDDGTGYFINNCEEQGLLFATNKQYDFTYTVSDTSNYRGLKVTLSSMEVTSLYTYTYSNNIAYYYLDGSGFDVTFSMGDSYFMYDFKAEFYLGE